MFINEQTKFVKVLKTTNIYYPVIPKFQPKVDEEFSSLFVDNKKALMFKSGKLWVAFAPEINTIFIADD